MNYMILEIQLVKDKAIFLNNKTQTKPQFN